MKRVQVRPSMSVRFGDHEGEELRVIPTCRSVVTLPVRKDGKPMTVGDTHEVFQRIYAERAARQTQG